MAGARLGCSRNMRASVWHRAGRKQAATFTRVTSVSWSRVLDGTSEAAVVIPIRDPGCCGALADVEPWSHELRLHRDGQRVWEGPLIETVDSRADRTMTLRARDVSAWLDARLIHQGFDHTAAPLDLATIAEDAIRDGLAPDDPDVGRWIEVHPSRITAGRVVAPDAVYVTDELGELAKAGLNWTVVGRRIVLFGAATALAKLGRLTDRHFAGDVPLRRAGLGTTTRVVARGEEVTATVGGASARYGLLEARVTADGARSTTAAQSVAHAALAGVTTPPLIIDAGDLGTLAPTAPVGIDQLVPGVVATISIRGNCQEVRAAMRLEKLKVTWSASGESVTPTFAPYGRP